MLSKACMLAFILLSGYIQVFANLTIKDVFQERLQRWEREIGCTPTNDPKDFVDIQSFYKIDELGPQALPYIFETMKTHEEPMKRYYLHYAAKRILKMEIVVHQLPKTERFSKEARAFLCDVSLEFSN